MLHILFCQLYSCAEADKKLDLWENSILNMDIQLPVAKIIMWALKKMPSLAYCFGQLFQARLYYVAAHKVMDFIVQTMIRTTKPHIPGNAREAISYRGLLFMEKV